MLYKNLVRKMVRKNGLGGFGYFKIIFIFLKKELCKKEKCKFLMLKNFGFFFLLEISF